MTEPSRHDDDEKPDAEDEAPPSSPTSKPDWIERDVVDPDAASDSGPSRPSAKRPDWIVGAEEALEAEFGQQSAAPERPATPIPQPRPHTPPPVNPYTNFAQSAAGRLSTSSWMDSGPPVGAASSRPSASDDQEHESPEPREPGAHHEPEAAHAAHGHDAADAGPGDDDLAGPDTPAATTPIAAPQKSRRAAPPPPPPPPRPWWEQALANASSTTGLITLGVIAVLAILAFAFTRPHQPTVSVASILHDPARLDGRTVTVHGRVGEVYPVGGGYSFYLMQGRDTIVVFTRTRTPVTDEKVAVTGVVSTGVLNGETREALLESAP
jgi:hypothetical protein